MKKTSIGFTIQVEKTRNKKTISVTLETTTFRREETNKKLNNTFRNSLNENKAHWPFITNILHLIILITQLAMILFGSNLAAAVR